MGRIWFEKPFRGYNGWQVTLFGWCFFRWHKEGQRMFHPKKRWHIERTDEWD